MDEKDFVKLVEEQDWLKQVGQKSDELINNAVSAAGEAGETARDIAVNSRLLGHTKHPTITDVPLGSWTVTLISDVLDIAGQDSCATSADVSLGVGLAASLLASVGGLADLSQTTRQADRRVGMMHGIFHGVTMLLYGGSFWARRAEHRNLGRALSFAGYGTLLVASYLGNELTERRQSAA